VERKRWAISILIPVLGLALAACNLNVPAGATATSVASPTPETGTVIAVTSSIPTSTPQAAASGNKLPIGTLILTQLGKPIAQLPDGQALSLPDERFGAQASPDARYGVRFTRNNNLTDLVLVDFSTDPPQTKDVPQAKGLTGPGVTWKEDSSGFAFFDFPPPDNPKAANGAIFYYDVASGQTKQLVPAPKEAGTIATPIAFSPNGKYLLYAVGAATGEGIGGPGGKTMLFDTTSNQSIALPADTFGFNQWLRDSQGFIALRSDPSGLSQVAIYSLADPSKPKILTPANTSDFFVDLSPDGKRIAVTSTPAAQTAQIANIFMMNLDGSNRKQLTKFSGIDQTITALVWGNDGIYYSLSGADNADTTWRMDLDGSNPTKVAEGTLNAIIGAH
jgi:Tol biopolymer transport system component